jgi:mRNA interferase HigB
MFAMNVIKRKTLAAFWTKLPESKVPLDRWYKISRKARWSSFEDAKSSFPATDVYKCKKGKTATIFDVGGNKFRVIALIDYTRQTMLVTHVLTHAEYDKDTWKAEIS